MSDRQRQHDARLADYLAVRPAIQTGDVIVFSGRGHASSLIKRHTGSDYSHVGMAIRTAIGADPRRRLLVIESTTLSDVPDVTGEVRKGVQMVLLSQRVGSYDGGIWWQRLRTDLADADRLRMEAWLLQQHAAAVPYDTAQAIRAGLDWWERLPGWLRVVFFGLAWTRARVDLSRLFCSELVTRALQVAGRVDASVNPSEMTPADVVDLDCLVRGLVPLA